MTHEQLPLEGAFPRMEVWNGVRGIGTKWKSLLPSSSSLSLWTVLSCSCGGQRLRTSTDSTVDEGCIFFFCRPCSLALSATSFSCSCLPRWPLRGFQSALAGRPHSLPLDQLLECVSRFEILPPEVNVPRCCCCCCCCECHEYRHDQHVEGRALRWSGSICA